MKQIIFLMVFLWSYSTYGQIITTYVGGGTNGLGDGGPASSAQIGYLAGMAFDAIGNLYLADGNNNRIRKIDTLEIINTFAGNGSAGFSGDGDSAINAELNGTTWVAVDTFGNIFITDANNKRIRKVSKTTGIITTIAGDGNSIFNGDSIQAINSSILPQDIIPDKYGNIYIADGNSRIRKVDASGIITTIAGNGISQYTGDGGLATTASLRGPYGMGIDLFGNLYVCDWADHRIRKIDITTGIISTVAGTGVNSYNGDSILAISANIDPFDVAFDSHNNMYIADFHNNRIRKVDTSGKIYTIAGDGVGSFSGDNGPASSAQIHGPEGVVLDKCDNVYLADFGNKRVRKVRFDPTCSTESVTQVNATNNINIYPNPARNEITITSNNAVNDITVINIIGQTVIVQNAKSNKVVLNVASLKSGIYFIKASDKNGGVVTRKFVKE